jgi:hypothetical protein
MPPPPHTHTPTILKKGLVICKTHLRFSTYWKLTFVLNVHTQHQKLILNFLSLSTEYNAKREALHVLRKKLKQQLHKHHYIKYSIYHDQSHNKKLLENESSLYETIFQMYVFNSYSIANSHIFEISKELHPWWNIATTPRLLIYWWTFDFANAFVSL